MTKKEIIDFLGPFDDDIHVGVRSDGLMAPHTYKLEYVPSCADHDAGVVIIQIGSVVSRQI